MRCVAQTTVLLAKQSQDIRRIVRNDARILNKLHRRVFLDKLTHEDCKIYLSFYVEASNRDAFMAVKQDLLLAFVDCVERNGAKLATPRTVVRVLHIVNRCQNVTWDVVCNSVGLFLMACLTVAAEASICHRNPCLQLLTHDVQ